MFPEWTAAVGFYIGAAVGSFLNVVIYRLPLGMSLWQPPSHCPSCKHRLGLLDLFPLFSFLLSGQRCRHCKAPIGWRYFSVEVFTGVLWGAFWYQQLVVGADVARFVTLALFASALVAAIFIDLRHYIIPDSINVWLLVFGLGYNVYLITTGPEGWTQVGSISVPSAVVGAIVGVLVYWFIALFGRVLFRKNAMGHGDIKLARGVGAVLFAGPALIAFGLSVVVGAVLGLVQVMLTPRGGEEEEEVDGYVEEPESVGSLLRCGLGYLLALDVLAIFFPKLNQAWFGDEPEAAEAVEDDWRPGHTTIPFGPYIALGALLAALFTGPLMGLVDAYAKWAFGGR
jgi:leader peptidase (prepilin peptidase)/N-methyltransferase